MKPLKTYNFANDNNKLQCFTDNNSFVGWIIKCKDEWISRPSNGWKPEKFNNLSKAERYLIASLKLK